MRIFHRSDNVQRPLLLGLLLCGACSSFLPYTDQLAERYELRQRDLTRVQFYTSEEFTLRHEASDKSAQITPYGTIRYYNGRRIEELRVPRHTPGTVIEFADRSINVSFAPGDNRNVVAFIREEDRLDEDRRDDQRDRRFAAPPPPLVAAAGQDGEPYLLDGDATHPIHYDGKLWTVHYQRRPFLMIRGRDVQERDRSVRTLPGRTIGK